MPKAALSDRVKSLGKSKFKDAKIREAVDAYRREQERPADCRKGAREIADQFGIKNQWQTILVGQSQPQRHLVRSLDQVARRETGQMMIAMIMIRPMSKFPRVSKVAVFYQRRVSVLR